MPLTRQKKEEVLKELVEKFSGAKSVVFGQYSGMSVAELSAMRSQMREKGVEFRVAKKTLFKLAAKENGLELPDEIVEGTVGAAFSYEDALSGPKLIREVSKKVEVVKLMGGVMEGKIYSVSEMRELAELPSREELLAKFMSMMQAPLRGFHGVLSTPLGSFARALGEYAKKAPQA